MNPAFCVYTHRMTIAFLCRNVMKLLVILFIFTIYKYYDEMFVL